MSNNNIVSAKNQENTIAQSLRSFTRCCDRQLMMHIIKAVKKYSVSADIIRIISAFFVVFLHSTDKFILWAPFKGGTTWEIIYYLNTLSRVAVPLFVMLSGYLIIKKDKTQNLKAFYKKRFLRILPLFFIWFCIYAVWLSLRNHTQITLQGMLQSLWFGNVWELYFLLLILEMYLLAPFFSNFIEKNNRKKQTLLLVLLTVVSVACSILANLPGFRIDITRYSITTFIPFVVFFYAGAYYRDVPIHRITAIILGFVYLATSLATNLIARGNMSAYAVFDYNPTIIITSICLFLSLKDLQSIIGKKLFSSMRITYISILSSAMFGVYLLHPLILDFIELHLHLLPWELHSPLLFYALLPAVLTFIVTLTIIVKTRKLPYLKYLFGYR